MAVTGDLFRAVDASDLSNGLAGRLSGIRKLSARSTARDGGSPSMRASAAFRRSHCFSKGETYKMPVKDRFVSYCEEQLAPLGEISSRYMFGGWCLYCDGVTFALVADGALYLKGGAGNISMFEARSLKPFKPFPDKDMTMKYFQAPPELFEDEAAMKLWCGGAIAAGQAKLKKKPR